MGLNNDILLWKANQKITLVSLLGLDNLTLSLMYYYMFRNIHTAETVSVKHWESFVYPDLAEKLT